MAHFSRRRLRARSLRVEALESRLALAAGTMTPLAGDWNGDGSDSLGLFDAASGSFYLRDVNAPGFPHRAVHVNSPSSAQPIAGDWDGDGSDGVGVLRGNAWLLRNSTTAGPATHSFTYGAPGDVPLVWR